MDMNKVIEHYVSRGTDIYLIDYDGTEAFSVEHKALIDLFFTEKIANYLILVFTNRTSDTKKLMTLISDEIKAPKNKEICL